MAENLLGLLYNDYLNQRNVDTILAFDDGEIKVHRLVLSLCSPRFESLFKSFDCCQKYLYFNCTSKDIMRYILEFMYRGEVSIPDDQVEEVLKAAETFQVKGVERIRESSGYKHLHSTPNAGTPDASADDTVRDDGSETDPNPSSSCSLVRMDKAKKKSNQNNGDQSK